MQLTSTLLVTLLSATTAMARPQTSHPHPGEASIWQISKYVEDCPKNSPCMYNFDIASSDPNLDFGGTFTTHCYGSRAVIGESPFTPCTNTSFTTQSQLESTGTTLFVTRNLTTGDWASGNVSTAMADSTTAPAANQVLRVHVY